MIAGSIIRWSEVELGLEAWTPLAEAIEKTQQWCRGCEEKNLGLPDLAILTAC
jgi:hypothetical protein